MPQRTFVALPLPPEVRASIAELVGSSRQGSPALRWIRPEQAHLTLAFLGDLDDGAVAELRSSVRRVAREVAPFESDVRGVGAFPTPARGRTLWLGWGQGARQVRELHALLTAALAAAGWALERRPFRPHVTLARCRTPADLRGTVAALERWRSASWTVTAIDVMASCLTADGAVHTRIERCPLAAGGRADTAAPVR